jgi:GntR family transcriptional regulator/MocR family aminotransferase
MAKYTPSLSPVPAPGGLHLVALLGEDADEASVVRACRTRDLAVAPLAAYYIGAPRRKGLVMGFAGLPAALAGDAARRLEAAIRAAGGA